MKNKFNELTYEELLVKLQESKKKYFSLRFDKVLSHLENPLILRTIRRDIARLKTIIHEYQLRIRER